MERRRKISYFKKGAKIVLGIPMSSAAVERLFSLAGLLLSKLRKRSLPSLIINSVYLKYARKMSISKLIKKIIDDDVLINEDELEKAVNHSEEN